MLTDNLNKFVDQISILRTYRTPFVLCDLTTIRQNCKDFRKAFPSVSLYYAVKALSDPEIIYALDKFVDGYDVASIAEIDKALRCGIDPSRIAFSNPVKPELAIKEAYALGVRDFAAQSHAELVKIARSAREASVYIRVRMEDTKSEVPLSAKFGCSGEEAKELLVHAKQLGLRPLGIAFHVGSQANGLSDWTNAILRSQQIMLELRDMSLGVNLINIGGGFPAPYFADDKDITEIAAVVNKAIRAESGINYMAEPGRYIVASSSVLVSSVIGVEKREGRNWLYLDTGKYQAFVGAMHYTRFPYVPTPLNQLLHKGTNQLQEYILTGPSCDSQDIIIEGVKLSVGIAEGDRLLFPNFGAYTVEYGANFNGFSVPPRYFIETGETSATQEVGLPREATAI